MGTWARYGYHASRNRYFVCGSAATVAAIFDDIRHTPAAVPALPQTPTTEAAGVRYPAACGPYRVVSVRDVTLGLDTATTDGLVRFPPRIPPDLRGADGWGRRRSCRATLGRTW
jgi:hypothetical protein